MTFVIFCVGNVFFLSHVNHLICALILSGGTSERMGVPKAFLKIGDITFLEKIVSAYCLAGIDKIIVVLNRNLFSGADIGLMLNTVKNIEFVCNSAPELGRFYSIKLGLQKLSHPGYCFIQNIDNPALTI